MSEEKAPGVEVMRMLLPGLILMEGDNVRRSLLELLQMAINGPVVEEPLIELKTAQKVSEEDIRSAALMLGAYAFDPQTAFEKLATALAALRVLRDHAIETGFAVVVEPGTEEKPHVN